LAGFKENPMLKYLCAGILLLAVSCKVKPVEPPPREFIDIHYWMEPKEKNISRAFIVVFRDSIKPDTVIRWEDTVMRWYNPLHERDFDMTVTLPAVMTGYLYSKWDSSGTRPTLHLEYDGGYGSSLWTERHESGFSR
jgi:hypothetical protein